MMFKVPTNHENPPQNIIIFEEFFGKYIESVQPKLNREYLPIYWTNYYISRDYGQQDMSDLQRYLDSLDRSKKYFTVMQWDDGILNKIKDLDLFIFASGGVGDYPIPLSSYYYDNDISTIPIEKRNFFASFVGAIWGRHFVREQMAQKLKDSFAITDVRYDYKSYLKIMTDSIFSLCPRGYGKTSFRIYESLMCGSIPIYIYDDPWIPYFDKDFESYGVLCDIKHIDILEEKLKNMTLEQINEKIQNGRVAFKNKYLYRAIVENIIKILQGIKI